MALSDTDLKKNRKLILFNLVLDLIGFSIIFPLVPGLLKYYIENARGIDSWLPILQSTITSWLPASQQNTATVIVLIGGVLASIYSLLNFLTAPAWGKLSDKIGRRKVLVFTGIGLSLSYFIWFFSNSFTLFIVSRIMAGIMSGNMGVATAAMADMSSVEDRTKYMGMVGATFGIGFVLGPTIGGISSGWNMAETFTNISFIHPFSFCAIISVLMSGLAAYLNSKYLKETLPEDGGSHKWVSSPFAALKKEAAGQSFKFLLLMNFLFVFIFSGFEFTITFFYKLDFQLSELKIGLIFCYLGLLIAIGQGVLVRRLVPKLREKKVALIGLLLIPGPLYLISTTAPSVGLSMTYLIPIAIGSSLVIPTLTGMASLMAPNEAQGLFLGFFRSSGSLARATGPLFGSYLYWFTDVKTSYLILGSTMAMVFLLALMIKDSKKGCPLTNIT